MFGFETKVAIVYIINKKLARIEFKFRSRYLIIAVVHTGRLHSVYDANWYSFRATDYSSSKPLPSLYKIYNLSLLNFFKSTFFFFTIKISLSRYNYNYVNISIIIRIKSFFVPILFLVE